MKQALRILRIQELFAKEEFLNFEDLCKLFDASKSSIRRDLMELEERGVLRRVHGGAISLQTRAEGMDFGNLSASAQDEETRMGRKASAFVADGQTVILGGGSTVVEVAKNLNNKSIQV